MCDAHRPGISELLARNRAWAQAKVEADAGFVQRLVAQQTPPYICIG